FFFFFFVFFFFFIFLSFMFARVFLWGGGFGVVGVFVVFGVWGIGVGFSGLFVGLFIPNTFFMVRGGPPRDRQPIGRPYLTLAIDVFTRCVLGMVVTLEAP
ncbi:hypothetical protein, partial [Enterobacter asburiae]